MTLADVRAGLQVIAANLSGLDAYWEDQSRPYINDITRAAVLMSFGPIAPLGRDEIRSTWDASKDHAEWTDTAIGLRRLPWRIKVESYEETNASAASSYLEKLRTRLRWMSTSAALNALGCSRATTGQVLDLSVPRDNRMTSIAVLDIGLNCVLQEDDPNGYTYIATVSGTATIGTKPFPYSEDIGT